MSSAPSPSGDGGNGSAPTQLPTSRSTELNGEQLVTSVLLYGGLGLLVLIIFSLLRRCARSKFSPRRHFVIPEEAAPELPVSVWRWIVPLVHPSRPDELILKHVGLDAYMSIRFMGLCFKLFAILTPIGLLVLAPLYATQGSPDNLPYERPSRIDKLTLKFIDGPCCGISFMWVPCVFVFVFTAIAVALLHREYLQLVPLQREFYLRRHRATYTILIERLPREIRSRRALFRYFEAIFPGGVERVDIVPMGEKTDELAKIIEERADVLVKLERAMWDEQGGASNTGQETGARAGRKDTAAGSVATQSTSSRPKSSDTATQHVERAESGSASGPKVLLFDKSGGQWMDSRALCYGKLCHCFGLGRYVSAVPYYEQRLAELNQRVAELQDELRIEIYRKPDADYAGQLKAAVSDRLEGGAKDVGPSNSDLSSDCEGQVEEEQRAWSFSMDKHEEAQWLLGDHEFGKPMHGGAAAFVTFNNKTASTSASRCMFNMESHFLVRGAPEPVDINWSRLAKHPTVVLGSRLCVRLLLILLLLLFGILTSTISATTNLTSIRSKWTALDNFLSSNSWAVPVFEQIAPLLLVIAFALVPPVLNLILDLRFEMSESAKSNSFFANYYVFLVTQMFLFFQISGAIIEVLTQSWDNPRELINTIAQMIPNNATFFMQFITIRMFWVLPVELVRLSDIVVGFLIKPIFCGRARTPRERRDDACGCRTFGTPGEPDYGSFNAQVALMLSIVITYSVMAPLVLVFGLIYFAIALVVFRHQLLYVYVKKFESGASNWPKLAIVYLFSLVIFQLTMLGIFALSGAPAQSTLMILPIVATVSYGMFMKRTYEHGNFFVSLSDARKYDIQCVAARSEYNPLDFSHPVLNEPAHVEPASVVEMREQLRMLHDPESLGDATHAGPNPNRLGEDRMSVGDIEEVKGQIITSDDSDDFSSNLEPSGGGDANNLSPRDQSARDEDVVIQ